VLIKKNEEKCRTAIQSKEETEAPALRGGRRIDLRMRDGFAKKREEGEGKEKMIGPVLYFLSIEGYRGRGPTTPKEGSPEPAGLI